MQRRRLMRMIGFSFLVVLAFMATGPLMGAARALLGGMPRVAELGLGFLATAILFGGVALVRSTAVGASWQFWGPSGFRTAMLALPVTLVLTLGEELVSRGYGFRQLIAACGAGRAAVLSALAFGRYHPAMAGFRPWGMGAVFVFALPALGGLVFGAAMIRTGGVALPLGLHLGGNWVQARVLGLGASAGAQPDAVFTASLSRLQAEALTAPDLVPHLPSLLAVGAAALVVSRWPWNSRGGLTA